MLIKKSSGINFTILYDNNFYQENIKTGWGFSCLVQGTKKTILFDTGGEGMLLLRNLQKLGIDPNIVDIIILSHNHGDHTGGLDSILEHNPDVTVYIPKSFPGHFIDRVKKYGTEVVKVEKSQAICKNVYSTGELGNWMREQSLIIKTNKGFVLLTGCAHPGIVRIVEESKKIINERFLLIMGGFHLKDKSQNEIENIIDSLRNLDVQYVGPTHCTGESARNIFNKEYGDYYIEVGAGKHVFLDDLE